MTEVTCDGSIMPMEATEGTDQEPTAPPNSPVDCCEAGPTCGESSCVDGGNLVTAFAACFLVGVLVGAGTVLYFSECPE